MKALVLILFFATLTLLSGETAIYSKQSHKEKCSEKLNPKKVSLPCVNSSSKIRILISLDTNYYLYGETVWLTVNIVNEGDKTDSIADFYEGELLPGLIISNGSGKILGYHGLIGCSSVRMYTVLKPGEQKSLTMEIRGVYGDIRQDTIQNVFGIRSVFSQGPYSFCLKKYDYDNKKYLFSNYINFNVISPDENERSNLVMLENVYNMNDNSPQEVQAKRKAFKEALGMIANSKYYSEAFISYISLNYFKKNEDYENITEDILGYIEKHPDDYWSYSFSWHYADSYIKNYGNKDIVMQKLLELKVKHPGTRLDSGIDQTLNSSLLLP